MVYTGWDNREHEDNERNAEREQAEWDANHQEVLLSQMKEPDYTNMCTGSEMLGDRVDLFYLKCRKCGQRIVAFSPTYNLVPVHDIEKEFVQDCGD